MIGCHFASAGQYEQSTTRCKAVDFYILPAGLLALKGKVSWHSVVSVKRVSSSVQPQDTRAWWLMTQDESCFPLLKLKSYCISPVRSWLSGRR
ncbi:hypothetical protein LSCM1_03336 [Leishmania martiniquensis]|uniref:Uncharacterized protein n=1 Tax=Leishmania martiniquensis TaxID=1580590 RepID=A0A836GLE5_9TRYP|nr:hypothetical protein LSCM1_03336 [Leishmania martiniquensis]